MMQREGAEFHRFTEPGDASRAMLGMSWSVLPLGGAPYEASVATIGLGDAALHLCRSSPFMAFAKTDADAAALQLPLEVTDSFILNGVNCPPRTVGICGGGSELLLASREDSTHAAIILPPLLAGTLIETQAASNLWQSGTHALLQAGSESWERAKRVVSAAGRAIASTPQVFETEQPRQALREALLHAARGLVSRKHGTEVRAPRRSKVRRRIVMAADAHLREHKDRPIYTSALKKSLFSRAGLARC